MKNKKTILLVASLIVVLVIASAAYNSLSKGNQPDLKELEQSSEQKEKVMLPEFNLIDINGNEVSSLDLLGKPTIINFWATWCGYCMKEMPDFQTAYETYGDKINFVMIDAVDGKQETEEAGRAYIEEKGYTFPVYFDTQMEGVISCGVTGFPSTLFVSADGEVLLGWPSYLSGDRLMEMAKSMISE